MLLPPHEFVKPASLADALETLGRTAGGARLLGGGTDVVFNMRGRLFQPDVLVSLKDLPELQFVETLSDGSLHMGAGCRLTDLERHPAVMKIPALAAAMRSVASRHIRNMATLGGNLCLDTRCWYTNQTAQWRDAKGPCLKTGVAACHAIRTSDICVALNASDTAPVLIALDAVATLVSAREQRQVAMVDFYTDDGVNHTVRRPDEVLQAVTVPFVEDRVVYLKEAARKGNDFSYGTIAARADGSGNRAGAATLVIGSLTTRPVILEEAGKIIVRQGLDDEAVDAAVAATRDALGALTNLYTPAAYKSWLARTLVRHALTDLREL